MATRLAIKMKRVSRGTVTEYLRSNMGGESGLLVVFALLVGAGSGLGAIVFRYLIFSFTELFTGHRDPSALGHFTNPHLPFLGPYVVLVIPVVGGLLYGPTHLPICAGGPRPRRPRGDARRPQQ